VLTIFVCERWQLCWYIIWGSKWTRHCNKKVGMYLLLVNEDNFTQWIWKALLLCILHSNKRSKSTLKKDNQKYELTSKLTWWSSWSWLQTQNLYRAVFGPLPKMMFFDTKILLYLVPELRRLKKFKSKGQSKIW
jgi:hypothetical protein